MEMPLNTSNLNQAQVNKIYDSFLSLSLEAKGKILKKLLNK